MDQNRGSKNKIQVVLLKYWIRTHHFGTSNWLQILNVIMLSFNVCQTLLITNSVVSACTNVSQRITVWFTKMSRIKKSKRELAGPGFVPWLLNRAALTHRSGVSAEEGL